MTSMETTEKCGFIPRRWVPWFIFLLGIVLFLPAIWSETGPTEKDEFLLSFRTPMEMHERGEWLTPWLDGEPRLRKPPLLYWAILLTYKTFGTHLWCARIWGVLAGAGMGVCACLFARELSRSDGLLAGLLTLGSIGVAIEARQAMLDLPLGLFTGLAVLFWIRWLRREQWRDVLSSAIMVGLSFLIKGPVGWFFFLSGAVTSLWIFRAWQIPKKHFVHLIVWVLIVAAISLPWPLLMKHLWGDRLFQVLHQEAERRRLIEIHAMSVFSAFTGALGLIFPWTPLVIGAVIGHCRQSRAERKPETTWLIAWFILSVLPFFFMKSSERYMLAISPAQGVLCAFWLENGTSSWRKFAKGLSVLLAALVLMALSVFVVWFKLGLMAPIICLGIAIFILWEVFGGVSNVTMALGVAVALAVCLGFVYPEVGINAMPADVQNKISGLTAEQFSTTHPAMLSMRLGYSVQQFEPEQFLKSAASGTNSRVVFFEAREGDEFARLAAENHLQVEEMGCFRTLNTHRLFVDFVTKFGRDPKYREALRSHSLESLKYEICYCRVTH